MEVSVDPPTVYDGPQILPFPSRATGRETTAGRRSIVWRDMRLTGVQGGVCITTRYYSCFIAGAFDPETTARAFICGLCRSILSSPYQASFQATVLTYWQCPM